MHKTQDWFCAPGSQMTSLKTTHFYLDALKRKAVIPRDCLVLLMWTQVSSNSSQVCFSTAELWDVFREPKTCESSGLLCRGASTAGLCEERLRASSGAWTESGRVFSASSQLGSSADVPEEVNESEVSTGTSKALDSFWAGPQDRRSCSRPSR